MTTHNVADRIESGIVLVPEDRQREGLVQTLSVAHNMVLARCRIISIASISGGARKKRR